MRITPHRQLLKNIVQYLEINMYEDSNKEIYIQHIMQVNFNFGYLSAIFLCFQYLKKIYK